MPRPTDNVLTWLRQLMKTRGVTTAELAERSGIARGRLRKLLSGDQAMLVDELMQLSHALEVSPSDLGWPEGTEAPDEPEAEDDDETDEMRLVSIESPPELPVGEGDPFGNPVEQIVRLAFELSTTFLFWAHVDQLEDSGVPDHVLAEHRERGEMLIRLDARFHRYNQPVFGDEGLTLTLSFDQLHDCTFPWSAIHKVIFDLEEEGEGPSDPKGRPHLRLVT
ncbi:MAG: helix-turn-helix transcriptional regulator [Myxococcota bacterium]